MLNATDFYTLADPMNLEECQHFNVGPSMGGFRPKSMRAVWTGEMRPPRKGEWYLSGAIVEAYRAPNDLSTPYHIAKLVKVEERIVKVIVQE